MKTTNSTLREHIKQSATELATFWRITRNDGQFFGYTSHDQPITIGAVVYAPQAGFTPSAIETKEGLSVDNLELDAIVLSVEFSEAELMAGRWDYAKVEIFQANWRSPNSGQLRLRKGTLGEVSFMAQGPRTTLTGAYKAELRGLLQPLSQVVGEVVSQMCRASLGDRRCKVAVGAYTFAAAVSAVNAANTSISAPALTQSANYFGYGIALFTSGANGGYQMEVQTYTPGNITFFQPLPYPIAVGDTFNVVAGCDRHFGTCHARFNNAANFRGEPHLPGQDKLVQSAR
jgi:uncharacterized phage protein (TIGR02218 family)